MPRAVIVFSPEPRFREEAAYLARYLLCRVGVSGIECILMEDAGPDFTRSLGAVLGSSNRGNDVLLLAYFGHGLPEGWAPNTDSVFSYARLVARLNIIRCPVLVLNDCCHAGALITACRTNNVSPERVGVIAASHESQQSYSWGLMPSVLRSWGKRERYNAGTVTPYWDCGGLSYIPVSVPEVLRGLPRLYWRLGALRDTLGYYLCGLLFSEHLQSVESQRWGTRELDRYFFSSAAP